LNLLISFLSLDPTAVVAFMNVVLNLSSDSSYRFVDALETVDGFNVVEVSVMVEHAFGEEPLLFLAYLKLHSTANILFKVGTNN
jgi:hypothetical protein